MDKNEIIKRIERFAPPELAENWDYSGYLVQTDKSKVSKVMLCLTVTVNVVRQAEKQQCEMIISHHPLFFVPLKYKNIDIYSAHTNLDRTKGGTTDILLDRLGLKGYGTDFLRYTDIEISVPDFLLKLKGISPNLRYVNNSDKKILKKIAFCSGSGSEFINEARENGADALVTGDLKFHTAVESEILLFDIGHFESEIGVLQVFEKLINKDCEVVYAREISPFRI